MPKNIAREPCPGERGATPAALAYLANFERLVIRLSGRFINLVPDQLDRAITDALKAIGEFAEVDRSYVFLFSEDAKRVSNTHEWCAAGIEPGIDDVQDAPVDVYSWLLPRLMRGDVVRLPDVASLPRGANEERGIMQGQGILSLINLPLICAGRTLGFIGFDSVRTRKTWCDAHINLLKVVGEMIAGAIERVRTTEALRRQLRLEQLIADTSSRFINLSGAELDRVSCAAGPGARFAVRFRGR